MTDHYVEEKGIPAVAKPKSAYIFYALHARPQVCRENPELGPIALANLISKQWKELSEDDRKPYQEMAEKDKQRYDKEVIQYGMEISDDDDDDDDE